MAYGFHACPFGEALLIATDRGVAGLAFVDEDKGQTRQDALADMMQRWPKARYVAAPEKTTPHARQIFASEWSREQPVRLVMIGTDFDVRVWETLLKIPMGRAVSYTDIARHIGAPSASRAVGLGGRAQPDLVRRALPPRAARRRQPRRLPLGPHPQARPDRLGDRAGGLVAGVTRRQFSMRCVRGRRQGAHCASARTGDRMHVLARFTGPNGEICVLEDPVHGCAALHGGRRKPEPRARRRRGRRAVRSPDGRAARGRRGGPAARLRRRGARQHAASPRQPRHGRRGEPDQLSAGAHVLLDAERHRVHHRRRAPARVPATAHLRRHRHRRRRPMLLLRGGAHACDARPRASEPCAPAAASPSTSHSRPPTIPCPAASPTASRPKASRCGLSARPDSSEELNVVLLASARREDPSALAAIAGDSWSLARLTGGRRRTRRRQWAPAGG